MGATASNMKKSGRGSVNNAKRLAAFEQNTTSQRGNADWGGCDPRWLAAVVVAATSQGMEVSFSLSKDGGAHGLKLYDYGSGERVTLWFNGDAQLDLEMGKIYEKLGGQT